MFCSHIFSYMIHWANYLEHKPSWTKKKKAELSLSETSKFPARSFIYRLHEKVLCFSVTRMRTRISLWYIATRWQQHCWCNMHQTWGRIWCNILFSCFSIYQGCIILGPMLFQSTCEGTLKWKISKGKLMSGSSFFFYKDYCMRHFMGVMFCKFWGKCLCLNSWHLLIIACPSVSNSESRVVNVRIIF